MLPLDATQKLARPIKKKKVQGQLAEAVDAQRPRRPWRPTGPESGQD